MLLGFISLLNVDEVVSLLFCKVERSRFRYENRLDLKVSCFLQNNRKCSSFSILLQSEHNLKFLQSCGLKYLPFSISNVCALITGTCFIQKIYAPSSSLQGKHISVPLRNFASIFFAYL